MALLRACTVFRPLYARPSAIESRGLRRSTACTSERQTFKSAFGAATKLDCNSDYLRFATHIHSQLLVWHFIQWILPWPLTLLSPVFLSLRSTPLQLRIVAHTWTTTSDLLHFGFAFLILTGWRTCDCALVPR